MTKSFSARVLAVIVTVCLVIAMAPLAARASDTPQLSQDRIKQVIPAASFQDTYFTPDGDGNEDTITGSITLAEKAKAGAWIINAAGKHVNHIISEQDMEPGVHTFSWDGRDFMGSKVYDGPYTLKVALIENGVFGEMVVDSATVNVQNSVPIVVPQPVQYVRVTAETTKLTVEPYIQYQIAKQGDVFTVIGNEFDYTLRYKLKLAEGVVGRVDAADVELVNLDIIPQKWGEPAGDGADIRSGPADNYPVLQQLAKGSKIRVLAQEGTWFRVLLDSGKQAWIRVLDLNVTDSGQIINGLSISNPVIAPVRDKDEPLTTISFDLARNSDVTFRIMKDNFIAFEQKGTFDAGRISFQWNGRNPDGTMADGDYTIGILTKELENGESLYWVDPASWMITVNAADKWPLSEARMKQIVTGAGFTPAKLVPDQPGEDKADIKVTLSEKVDMIVSIVDNQGLTVARLNDEASFAPGTHSFTWDGGQNGLNSGIAPNGTYYLNIWMKDSTGLYGQINYPGAQVIVERSVNITPKFVTVTSDIVNVRSGPGTTSQVVAQVHKNDVFVIDRTANGWYRVKLGDGTVGFVSGTLIKEVQIGADSLPKTQLNPQTVSWYDTDGNRVVFYDQVRRGFAIIDLKTGQKEMLYKVPEGITGNPSISGSYLVWRENQNGKPAVVVYNYQTETEKARIVPEDGYEMRYAVSGDYLVYRAGYRMFLYKISTGENKAIADYPAGGGTVMDISGSIDLDGEYVVFNTIQYEGLRGNITVYNIKTGELKNIAQFGNPLKVSGGKMIISRAGGFSVYDLTSGKDVFKWNYTDSDSRYQNADPDIYMNRVIFVDKDLHLVDLNAANQSLTLTSGTDKKQFLQIINNQIFYLNNSFLVVREITTGGSAIPPVKEPQGSKGVIQKTGTVIRSGPDVNSPLIKIVYQQGVTFEAAELVSGWYKARFYNGLTGYVPADSVLVFDGKDNTNITYTVQPGDTMQLIADKFMITAEAVAKASGLYPNQELFVGQHVIIPYNTAPIPAPGQAPGTGEGQTGDVIYVVQPGDALWKIAQKFGTTVDAIVQANNLDPAKYLAVGQKLIIPGQPQAPPPQQTVYSVQAGDTLWKIAQKFGTTIDAIVQANNLDPAKYLVIGQQLVIPGQSPAPTPSPEPIAYSVQAGDTLWKIAQKFNTTVDAIARLNQIDPAKPILVGQKLQIPG